MITISTDEATMDTAAESLSAALAEFDAPSGVHDVASFRSWLEAVGGYGWIEIDGARVVEISQ